MLLNLCFYCVLFLRSHPTTSSLNTWLLSKDLVDLLIEIQYLNWLCNQQEIHPLRDIFINIPFPFIKCLFVPTPKRFSHLMVTCLFIILGMCGCICLSTVRVVRSPLSTVVLRDSYLVLSRMVEMQGSALWNANRIIVLPTGVHPYVRVHLHTPYSHIHNLITYKFATGRRE